MNRAWGRDDVLSRRLRASASYKLVGFDDLEQPERSALRALAEDPSFFGLLKPENGLLPSKSVSKSAALLLLSLQSPRRIPTLIESTFGEDTRPLHALIAEGVVEIEHTDGVFVSGAAALRLLQDDAPRPVPEHAVSRLACDAIRYAAQLDGLDAAALSARLYAFGRVPCTASCRRRFAEDGALIALLTGDGATRTLLESSWTRRDREGGAWLSWSRTRSIPSVAYKLYVSPRLPAMPDVFAVALRSLHANRCDHFKIGRGGDGVCRPDKMVAYFSSLDDLRACATHLQAELSAARAAGPGSAQGVPFTAPLDEAGLLTWGIDPPPLAYLTPAFQTQSWRQWITSRVAVALLATKPSSPPDEWPELVFRRLELDGIDCGTWLATPGLWRDAPAPAGGSA